MKYLKVGIQEHKAIVDNDQYERLSKYKWILGVDTTTGAVFAYRRLSSGKVNPGGKRQMMQLSHEVLGAEKGTRIFHKNGNRLDCRVENMVQKIGGTITVADYMRRKKFKATVSVKRVKYVLGFYPSRKYAEEIIELAQPTVKKLRTLDMKRKEIRRELDLAVGREV